ncbi:MAG: Crp/Fnr family transcriptional regulator [Anaerolineae bacterium]|nr:Crp/Fnr family transcriptional regulator [Anaerolineae bacterium]
MLTSTSIKGFLETSLLFSDLPAAALDQIAAQSRARRVESGEMIFCQGDPARSMCVIVAGQVRLVQHTPDGKDVTLATFGPGDLIGVLAALDDAPYPGSAEALEACELLVVPVALMESLMGQYAALTLRVLKVVSARLHEAHERIRELSTQRVQQRIARSLLRLAGKVGERAANGAVALDMRLSRQDLAQMNGTTLETVSRTLAAWERDGLIQAGRERITLLQPHTLMLIAEDMAG